MTNSKDTRSIWGQSINVNYFGFIKLAKLWNGESKVTFIHLISYWSCTSVWPKYYRGKRQDMATALKEVFSRRNKIEHMHFLHAYLVVSDSVTPWIVARQAPLSMEFSRQEYWNRLPFPTPGSLPDPGVKSTFLASPALAGHSFPLHHLGSS